MKSELEKFGFIDPVAIADRMVSSALPIFKESGILIVDLKLYRVLKFRKWDKAIFTYSRVWKKHRAIF